MKVSDPQQVFSCFWGSGPNSSAREAALQGVLNRDATAPNTAWGSQRNTAANTAPGPETVRESH